MKSFSLLVVVVALASGGSACSDEVLLKNAEPRVTWVASEYLADEDIVRLTIWLADIDGDPVDMDLSYAAPSVGPSFDLAPGSYPLTGRSTREYTNDPNGAPHQVLWLAPDVAGEVTLNILVDDRPFDDVEGDTYTVAFDPFVDNAPIEATRVE